MNDFVRDKFTTVDGAIPLPAEILAGGCVSVLSDILSTLSADKLKNNVKRGGKPCAKYLKFGVIYSYTL